MAEEEKKIYKINVIFYNGEKKLHSPIPPQQFYQEMVRIKQENATNPVWSGWYEFRTATGKFMALNIATIIGVEEV